MFESRVQDAWDDYKNDLALGRILIWLTCYNLFLFFLSSLFFHTIKLLALFPVFVAFFFFFFRPKIIKIKKYYLFCFNIFLIALCIVLNYYLVGEIDKNNGLLPRRDALLSSFDLYLFGNPVSLFFESLASSAGLLGSLFYDFMILAYISYYILPIYGAYLYFGVLKENESYKIGRFFFSVLLYFAINFIFYLLVPVTGPQYWLTDFYTTNLPFTDFGKLLYETVQTGQTTFIDCFPSGHTGVAFLTTIWLYRVQHPQKYFILMTTVLIVFATLAMRYHYTLDLLCALPLAYICHRLAWVFIPVEIKRWSAPDHT